MTVLLDHDGRPFHCGTYYPSAPGGMPSFVELLHAVDDVWRNRRDDLLEQAARLTEPSTRTGCRRRRPSCRARQLDEARQLLAAHDGADGGFGRPRSSRSR